MPTHPTKKKRESSRPRSPRNNSRSASKTRVSHGPAPASDHAERAGTAWAQDALHTRRGEWERPSQPPSAPPSSALRRMTPALAADCERMYAASRTTQSDGCVRLDEDRFVQSMSLLAMDPLTEQDLYSLALMAAADGESSLFKGEESVHLRAS